MRRQIESEPLDKALTTDAIRKGYGLTWWSPAVFKVDPVILYKQGREVFRWEYIPSIVEVQEKIEEIEKQ